MDKRIVNAIAVVVTVVWAASFIADIVLRDYDPSPYLHFIFAMIVGSAFGTKFLNRGEGNGTSK